MRELRGKGGGLGVAAAVAWPVATAAPARGGSWATTRRGGNSQDGVPHLLHDETRAPAADNAGAGRGLWH